MRTTPSRKSYVVEFDSGEQRTLRCTSVLMVDCLDPETTAGRNRNGDTVTMTRAEHQELLKEIERLRKLVDKLEIKVRNVN